MPFNCYLSHEIISSDDLNGYFLQVRKRGSTPTRHCVGHGGLSPKRRPVMAEQTPAGSAAFAVE
jgi:hypothetical protein